jgi:hypothetical protein
MSFWVGLGYMIWTLQSLGDQILAHSLFKVKKFNLLDYLQGLMIIARRRIK